jgi:hypothetical protein
LAETRLILGFVCGPVRRSAFGLKGTTGVMIGRGGGSARTPMVSRDPATGDGAGRSAARSARRAVAATWGPSDFTAAPIWFDATKGTQLPPQHVEVSEGGCGCGCGCGYWAWEPVHMLGTARQLHPGACQRPLRRAPPLAG